MMPISALGGVARQARVGVERDAVADRRQHVQLADLGREARVGRAAQQAVELLDLAALALPAHPRVLAGVPLPVAMEQEEAIRIARRRTRALSAVDAGARARRECGVVDGASGVAASAKSLRIAKWMRGSRLPSASTSTCSSSVVHTGSRWSACVGTIDHRAGAARERRRRSRGAAAASARSASATARWTQRDRDVARRR